MDFIISCLLLIICCIIGCIIGNLISNYFNMKTLKKSIFSNNDFTNVDDDFFSDDVTSSITDINIKDSHTNTTDNDNIVNPKFF